MTRDEISAATGRETELKFSLRAETAVPARTDDDRTRAVLAALESAGFETAGPKTHEIADEYFDTPELALDEMGHSVRIRNKDGDRWVTVKAGGRDASGVFDRRETEFPIDRARHERCVATGFAELLDELLPDLPKHGETEGRRLLARTVRVINKRAVYRIRREDQELALSIDRFFAIDERNPKRLRQSRHFDELEIEAENEPGRAAIEPIRAQLAGELERLGYEPSSASKYGQAVRALRLNARGPVERFRSLRTIDQIAVLSFALALIALVLGVIGLLV